MSSNWWSVLHWNLFSNYQTRNNRHDNHHSSCSETIQSSTRYKECFLAWSNFWRSLHPTTTRNDISSTSNTRMQTTKSFLWPRTSTTFWFNRFSSFFLKYGFFCSPANSALFFFHWSDYGSLIILHVDDMLFSGSTPTLVSGFIQLLIKQWVCNENSGPIHHFLEMGWKSLIIISLINRYSFICTP